MSSQEENIFGQRLKLARKMAGMSLQELSDVLANKVTKQALNKYEMGQMKPSSDVLVEISKALKIPSDFFLRTQQVEFGQISFRKKVALTKKDEESIVEKVRDRIERYIEIENILAIAPSFENPLSDIIVSNKKEVEALANKLRDKWDFGKGPIAKVVEALELKGVKIILIEAVDEIDGFAAFTSQNIPVVVVNTKGRSIERIRFTIVHELAHILLNINKLVPDKEIEILCHCFASCFLLPSDMLINMIGGGKRTYIAIKELLAIKEYYGISIRAIVHRLRDLEVITPNYYQRWVIYMSKEYGHKSEPGAYKIEEKAVIFERLINRALSEEIISISKASALTGISVNELRQRLEGVD